VRSLADDVRGGAALSAAMAGQPRSFPAIYVAMVRAGEAGGVLEVVLERLGLFLEKSERLRGRIRAAMVYPAMIALVAGGVVTALMMFVVPKFEAVFASLLKGQPLPGLTAAVLAAGRYLQMHTTAALLVPLLSVVVCLAAVRLPAVRRWRDRLVLRLPGIGGLATKSAVARFSRTLGTLLAAGVPILAALRITRETGDNTCVAEALSLVHDRVEAGESFAAPLAATKVFPDLVPSMIEVGEETGTLPEMLGRIADTYDEEVDAAVVGLTALIEPLTIAVMAVVVGAIVISMFLPIVRIIQTLA
jgi:type IV pilus assembly protein PilC